MTAVINLLLCLVLLKAGEAYKALVLYPVPSKSHSILGNGFVRHLLNDGFEVTYVTALGYKNPPKNLRIVDISDNLKIIPDEALNLRQFLDGEPLNQSKMFSLLSLFVTETVKNKHFEKILNDPNEHFDVVLVEWMYSEVFAGLATLYNCPLVWLYPADANSQAISLIDAALNPAFSSTIFSSTVPPFTFFERVGELFARVVKKCVDIFYLDVMETELYENHIVPLIKQRGRDPPAYYDVRYNASLLLADSHVSLGLALPLPQNYVTVGGQHLDEELTPLPKDLQKILDDAKDGVIYFSMGSSLKSKDWPEIIKNDLLKMFGQLKQTVIWKFEEKLDNTPKNVHILEWAPQQSILAHPNTILFISHGGLLSTTETICHGVPIIGVPVFGDQPTNIQRAVDRGFAVEVKLSYKVANDLKLAIGEVMINPKYREKVKELSFIYHDRPVKPGALVTHWVRHVIQTRGAPHLRSPSARVPLYQQLYLDLAVLLVLLSVISLLVLKRFCCWFCQKKKVNKRNIDIRILHNPVKKNIDRDKLSQIYVCSNCGSHRVYTVKLYL